MNWKAELKLMILPAAILAAAFCLVGCDDGYDSTPGTSGSPAENSDGTNVDIDAGDSAVRDRAERPQERRENLRDAIDDVDVEVGNGGVKVDVH